jgi:hypothetical protein
MWLYHTQLPMVNLMTNEYTHVIKYKYLFPIGKAFSQVAGDQDPYSPLHVQQELFSNLVCGSDQMWSILADADYAVHLLAGRSCFANLISSFLQNGKQCKTNRYF